MGSANRRKLWQDEFDVLHRLLQTYMSELELLMDTDLSKDREVIQKRYETEGCGFISKTLPAFLLWFRQCLEAGAFSPFPMFKTYRKNDQEYPFPAFLRGLVQLFSTADGEIIYAVTPAQLELQKVAFTGLSTICQSFGAKYEYPLSPERLDRQIIEMFKFDSQEVFRAVDVNGLSDHALKVAARARDIIAQIFEEYEEMGVVDHEYGSITHRLGHDFPFKHGKGSLAHPYKPHEKYTEFSYLPINYGKDGDFREIYNPSPSASAELGYFYPQNRRGRAALIEWAQGGYAEVIIVPKNATKGRIICKEPLENMFIQQGIRLWLYSWLEHHPRTRRLINFISQKINQDFALAASRSGYHGTLDLSNASDSVTVAHIGLLFREPVYDLLMNCRSNFMRATVGVYKKGAKIGVKELSAKMNKFAPMGSALCFPVEALVFWALSTAHLECIGCPDTKVRVYGDDLIVPGSARESLSSLLAEFKIKVNESKSFSEGPFRESCGMDAFDGVDVTPPTRISSRLPSKSLGLTDNQLAAAKVAWVDYANTFEGAGFPCTALEIRKAIGKLQPSLKSIPRFPFVIEQGFLYYLDYSSKWGLTDLGVPEKDRGPVRWNYGASAISKRPCLSGEQLDLFRMEENPFYQGRRLKVWAPVNEPYNAGELGFNENLRYMRWMCEGSSELPGNWFTDRSKFSLKRKTKTLT